MTAQLGGPIKQDKLFYFLSAQRESITTTLPAPRTRRTDISPRLFGKLSWMPTPSDTLTLSGQYDQFNVEGPLGLDSPSRTATTRTSTKTRPT